MTVAYEYRPGRLYLNVTNRCSNDCRFCVRRGPDFSLAGFDMRLEREPSPQEVLADIDRCEAERGSEFDEVIFCGFGEPSYRLDVIAEVGRALRARGALVRLNTNGQASLINGLGALARIAPAVDAISVSLNAPDADSYTQLCRPRFGGRAFDAVVEHIRQATSCIPHVTATVVGAALSAHQVVQCEQLVADLKVPLRVR